MILPQPTAPHSHCTPPVMSTHKVHEQAPGHDRRIADPAEHGPSPIPICVSYIYIYIYIYTHVCILYLYLYL